MLTMAAGTSSLTNGVLLTPDPPIPTSTSYVVRHHQHSPRSSSSSTTEWEAGMEVVASYSFAGNSQEDLSFNKDDVLLITEITKDPNWFRARKKDGGTGMIPANYVKRKVEVAALRMPWFHGRISREEAERLLARKGSGTYLVRESTNFPGDFTLCVAYQNKVEHYRIQLKDNQTLTCDDEEFFQTLPQLIEHYEKDADGLCHKLVSPILKDGTSSPSETQVLTDSHWAIKRHDLDFGDAIGRGEFADVFVGHYKKKKVALKVLKQSSPQMVEALMGEASLMASLRHKNLVELLGVVLDDLSDLCLVTEFMSNGNLVDYLRSRGRHQVAKQQQISFACDVCEGMEYLESKLMVHRDLAARNVLLADDMTAKVSDFGLAKHADSSSDDKSGKFPIKWTAPEALRFSKFTSKSDMWSFGVLIWEIYSFGRVPYPRIPIQDVVRHIEKGYRMEPPDGCPQEIADLMGNAWEFRPEERPTFKQMLVKLKVVEAGGSL